MGKVVTVTAGKGGTGKTTTVAAVSSCLAALGYKTICTDFDRDLKNLEFVLGMSEGDSAAGQAENAGLPGLIEACRVHPRISNLYYLPYYTYGAPDKDEKKVVASVFEEIRGEFDFCVVDSPSINAPVFKTANENADMSIIITNGELPGMSDVRKASTVLFKSGVSDLRLLINRFHPANTRLIRSAVVEVIEAADIPLIGIIPEDKIVFQALHLSIPLVLYYKRYSVYHFLDAARRVAGENVPWRIRLGLPRALLRNPSPQQPAEDEQAPDNPPPESHVGSYGDPGLWAKSTLPPEFDGDLVKIQDVKAGLFTSVETLRNRIWLHDVLDDNDIPYRIEIEGHWPGRRKYVETQCIYVEEKNAGKARRLIKEYKRTENILHEEGDEEAALSVNEDGMPQKECPACGMEVDFDFLICPHCKEHFS